MKRHASSTAQARSGRAILPYGKAVKPCKRYRTLPRCYCPMTDRCSGCRRVLARCAVGLALGLVLLATGDCRASWWWRDTIESRWTEKTLELSAPDQDWQEAEPAEASGLSFRARNDSDDLYLMVSAMDRDSRSALEGAYRQDVTLWFLAPDGKAKRWGLRLAFSQLEAPGPSAAIARKGPPEDAAGTAPNETKGQFPPRPEQLFESGRSIEPQMVLASGIEISTALPADIEFHSAHSRREVWYALRIPLKRLNLLKGKSVPYNFVLAEASDELKAGFEAKKRTANSASRGGAFPGGDRNATGGRTGRGMEPMGGGMDSGMGGGGMGMEISGDGNGMHGRMNGIGGPSAGRGMGGPAGAAFLREPTLPDPLDLRLSVRLARPAKAHS